MRQTALTLFLAASLATACGFLSEARAQSLVERIGVQLGQYSVVRAEFAQAREMAALKRPLVTSGTLVFARDKGVLWRIEAPYRITFALGADQVAEIAADGSTRRKHIRDVPALSQVGRILRALFGGDTAVLRDVFEVTATGDGMRWELELQPHRPEISQRLARVRLSGGQFINRVVVEEANGDRTDMRLRNMRADTGLTAAELSFLGATP